MIISDERRFLFIHVQKTGGSSAEQILEPLLPDARTLAPEVPRHARLTAILRAEPGIADYWVAGFVRNPFARLYSWYGMVERFRSNHEADNPLTTDYLDRHRFLRGCVERYHDFESFVLQGPDDWVRLRTPQVRYLRAGRRRADFVGRQESYDADMRTIIEHLGLGDAEILRANAAPHISDPHRYREHYTPAMREHVAQVFARDLTEFGYEF